MRRFQRLAISMVAVLGMVAALMPVGADVAGADSHPRVLVDLNGGPPGLLVGNGWLAATAVTVTIGGVATQVDVDGTGQFIHFAHQTPLLPGTSFEVSSAEASVEGSVDVTARFDVATGRAWGTAPADAEVGTSYYDDGELCSEVAVTAVDAIWEADHSASGCDRSYADFVLVAKTDGDVTIHIGARVPYLSYNPDSGTLVGTNWGYGDQVEVTAGEDSETVTVNEFEGFGYPSGLWRSAGALITASDPDREKSLTVSSVSSVEFSVENETVIARTEPEHDITWSVWDGESSCLQLTRSDGEGVTFADFSDPSLDFHGSATCDLDFGLTVSLAVIDDDGDRTSFQLEIVEEAPPLPELEPDSVTCESTTNSFADVEGLPDETLAAIGCLADLGIALGTGAGEFSPTDDVDRWQMALFLIRMLEALGVEIPVATDQGFNDIDDLPEETQEAINQLAALGITTGTSEITFGVEGEQTRWQMALFIIRVADLVGLDIEANPPATFVDTSDLPAATRLAIDQLAALGITNGTGPATFDPNATVPRWQMALFLVRMLEASGVTVE